VVQNALSLSRLGFAAFRVSWRLVGAEMARLTARRSDFQRDGRYWFASRLCCYRFMKAAMAASAGAVEARWRWRDYVSQVQQLEWMMVVSLQQRLWWPTVCANLAQVYRSDRSRVL